MFGFLEKSYTYKKSDGERFSAFCFFCVRERQIRNGTQILATKSCCKKITKQKAKKRATTKSPKKRKKMAKSQKMPNCGANCRSPPIRVKIHVFLNFAINDVAARSIFSVKSKEGTRAVILHSVLAPADTCSTCGVRLKFEFWQLGFQGFESQPLAL